MRTQEVSLLSGAALLALTVTASAGPMSVASSKVLAPPQTQTEPVAYRYHHRYYHRYYGWNPGAAVAGAALGLATLPFALATGGYYYGHPYYGYGYGYPYYGYGYPYYYY